MAGPQPNRPTAVGRKRRTAVAALITMLSAQAGAQEAVRTSLGDLSLEELGNIEITSVSPRAERLSDAAASVFVITADDIRRSGANSLPEVLRLAPNLFIGRASTPGYVVTARGFAGSAANKLLVLIDGRSVYTPLFSGVFWDVQTVMLEDVERIEVVSGPGSTLWGVNAVNGVINIITKSARDTQGGLVAAGGGNQVTDASLRYGAKAGADGAWRVYAQHFDRESSRTAARVPKDDALQMSQAGFRADWSAGSADQFSTVGNVYRGEEGQPPPGMIVTGAVIPLGMISLSGANVAARWTRSLGQGSILTVSGYYDRTERIVRPQFSETLDIADLQVQYALAPIASHSLSVGGEYRTSRDRVTNSTFIAFLPERLSQQWTALYVQDDIRLHENVRASLGARVERNDYTGTEFLPSARLAWKVAADHLLWTSATRTVRAPSRLDADVFIPGSPRFLLRGGPDVRSEVAEVYEIGYRGRPTPRSSLSATLFHADYDHLRTQEINFQELFVVFANGMEGKTNGVELWGSFDVARTWRLSAGYARLDKRLQLKPGSNDNAALTTDGHDAEHRWLLRSSHDLPGSWELDAIVRHTSSLSTPTVPGYIAVDARLAWRARDDLELSVSAQNLFDRGHGEFSDVSTRSELGRTVFFKVVGRF